jgi:hypothetical protein
MADLLLLFTPDKKPAADQLAEAAGAAGYPARLEEVAAAHGSAILTRARAGPTLLLWSRALAGAAVADGWLSGLRQLPNVIEVSTDGIAPDTGEVGRVVLLSGWRGQPYHLGWQQIVERLGRIAPAGTRPQPEREAPAGPGAIQPPVGKTSRFTLPALGLAALIAVAVAATWNGSSQRAPAPVEPPRPRSAAAAAPAPPPAPLPAPVSAPAPPAVVPSPQPVREESGAPVEPVRIQQARPAPPPRKSVSPPPGPGPVKRYSRRYSKTMRLFCARTGRGTPQCRTFARSMRALGR